MRESYATADNLVDDRRHLLTIDMDSSTHSGVIGRPSLATEDKGRSLLGAFSHLFKPRLGQLVGE